MHPLPTSANIHVKGRNFRKFPVQKTNRKMTVSQPNARHGKENYSPDPQDLGKKHYHHLQTNYSTSEKQLLGYYWASTETENLTVGH